MKNIKQLLNSSGASTIIGAAHALIAEIAQQTNYDGIWLSSFEAHAWDLLPDANILHAGEYSTLISKISDRITIPILVDGDEGGASSINTIRMVREYHKAGAQGICIEDNPSPKRCSFYGMSAGLEKTSLMCGKIQAALENRSADDFAVIARTEALIQHLGHDVALDRAKAYNDAGCEGFLIHSKSESPEEVLNFADSYHKANLQAPLVCVPTTYNTVSVNELESAGYSLIIYANYSVRSVVQALFKTFSSIQKGGSLSCANEEVVEMKKIFELIRVDKLKSNQEKYGS